MTIIFKSEDEILKFNPYHGKDGRFTSANMATSFTITTRDSGKQYLAERGKEREKARTSEEGVKEQTHERTAKAEVALRGLLKDGAEVSLKGVDPDLAEGIVTEVNKVMTKYPAMKDAIGGITSDDIKGEKYFTEHAGTMAAYNNLTTQIYLNREYYGDKDKFEKAYQDGVERKFHPENTNANSAIVHEMGHAIDNHISKTLYEGYDYNWRGKRISGVMLDNDIKNAKKKGEPLTGAKVKEELCGYATVNHKEYFAEGFSEYMCSPSPRPMAQSIGKRLDTYYKKYNKMQSGE